MNWSRDSDRGRDKKKYQIKKEIKRQITRDQYPTLLVSGQSYGWPNASKVTHRKRANKYETCKDCWENKILENPEHILPVCAVHPASQWASAEWSPGGSQEKYPHWPLCTNCPISTGEQHGEYMSWEITVPHQYRGTAWRVYAMRDHTPPSVQGNSMESICHERSHSPISTGEQHGEYMPWEITLPHQYRGTAWGVYAMRDHTPPSVQGNSMGSICHERSQSPISTLWQGNSMGSICHERAHYPISTGNSMGSICHERSGKQHGEYMSGEIRETAWGVYVMREHTTPSVQGNSMGSICHERSHPPSVQGNSMGSICHERSQSPISTGEQHGEYMSWEITHPHQYRGTAWGVYAMRDHTTPSVQGNSMGSICHERSQSPISTGEQHGEYMPWEITVPHQYRGTAWRVYAMRDHTPPSVQGNSMGSVNPQSQI